ncbi:hypothetical protein ACFTWM_24055 [Streptomyces bacillaris]|uniref:hypothetical protein n=1 Tax=Streptomyces bacillaris TaxID=68179 RepID=UPI00362622AD
MLRTRWLAEPSDAERDRRGGRGAFASGPGSARWLAEPSDAERDRRGGRDAGVAEVSGVPGASGVAGVSGPGCPATVPSSLR